MNIPVKKSKNTNLNIRINEELLYELKFKCAFRNLTVTECVTNLIEEYLSKLDMEVFFDE